MVHLVNDKQTASQRQPQQPIGFLLSQVGAWVAQRWGERVSALGLTRPEAAVLWNISAAPALSQRQLAARLQVSPSRMVAMLDDLQVRALIERVPDSRDRRVSTVVLTTAGQSLLEQLRPIAKAHNGDVTRSLDPGEVEVLRELLQRLAQEANLSPRVHPGLASS